MKEHFRDRLLDVPTGIVLEASISDYDMSPDMKAKLKDDRPLRPAAVLVPVVDREEGLTVLLTKRSTKLPNHAGQISFPGGKVEEGDDGPVDTALRETEEEIGLSRDFIEVVGALDVYETGTGFTITPIVGFVQPGFELTIDHHEVDEAFEVPLDFVLDPGNHRHESAYWRGALRHYYVMPYEGYHIWGATAGMLVNLWHKIRD